jgi:hypothetical protein
MIWQNCLDCKNVYTYLQTRVGSDIAHEIISFLKNDRKKLVSVHKYFKERYFGDEIHEEHITRTYLDILDIDNI